MKKSRSHSSECAVWLGEVGLVGTAQIVIGIILRTAWNPSCPSDCDSWCSTKGTVQKSSQRDCHSFRNRFHHELFMMKPAIQHVSSG